MSSAKGPSATVDAALEASAARHGRLCPRQVLGVRMGLAGARALGVTLPRVDKRLLVFAETDGCFADGLEAATGCSSGHRTRRLEDLGKVAATFVDVMNRGAFRVAPRSDVRERAAQYLPGERRRYFQQLHGYRAMPDDELLSVELVKLTLDLDALLGRAGVRAECARCREEILNGREITADGRTFCVACVRGAYYTPARESHAPVDCRMVASASQHRGLVLKSQAGEVA